MREPIKDGEIRPSEMGIAFVIGAWQNGENNIENLLEYTR